MNNVVKTNYTLMKNDKYFCDLVTLNFSDDTYEKIIEMTQYIDQAKTFNTIQEAQEIAERFDFKVVKIEMTVKEV